jgi:hypothetical protein
MPYQNVEIVSAPISERYCQQGDICQLDTQNNLIRCSGCWFTFDDRWVVKKCG